MAIKKEIPQIEKSRLAYFWTFVTTVFVIQFLYHDFDIYLKVFNTGSYDIADLPLTRHNKKLYAIFRTEINMTDFVKFVEVDVHDQRRDNLTEDPVDLVQLTHIDNSTVFSKVQLRRYLSKYMPERLRQTGSGPVFNMTKALSTDRFYWSSKMAKDFVIFTKKEHFSYADIEGYFTDRVVLNFMNEM